jgi:hypothetical protein
MFHIDLSSSLDDDKKYSAHPDSNLKATFQFEAMLQREGVDRLSVWQT